MGCSALRGKLRMHQSLLPQFAESRCAACGRCVANCPEGALELPAGAAIPVLDPDACIGCGECEAVCAPGRAAVTLHDVEITDWQRGQQTLPARMADYALGLMNGRWNKMIHVLHLYSITPRCDCLDVRQGLLIEQDLGFLVGTNPFAVDAHAAHLLARLQPHGTGEDLRTALAMAGQTKSYLAQSYGIRTDTPLLTRSIT